MLHHDSLQNISVMAKEEMATIGDVDETHIARIGHTLHYVLARVDGWVPSTHINHLTALSSRTGGTLDADLTDVDHAFVLGGVKTVVRLMANVWMNKGILSSITER